MQTDKAATASQTFAANRAVGEVAVEVRANGGVTRRGPVHEAGSLRVRFPSPEQQGLSAVLVNTAGGVAGGDRFSVSLDVQADARLTLTTAAAEKVYRSHGPAAQLDITLKVASGGHLAWLPQETILFDQARAERRIDVELADDASLLLSEMVIFGRSAMGETMRHGRFVDRWRMRRGGKFVFAETVRLDGDIGNLFGRRAVMNGGVAIGTALIVPGDAALVERLRAAADAFGAEVGISAWNGFAMARFCAQNAAKLRADMMTVLGRAAGRALPRLWLS
ncbi:urease accessory protein UreD [Rhodopseudomonas palustris]|uniref:urease accessory protein UreD n=1 Tax=Rhodopseudomonas palustris TaxID=1076 RepID=UPI000641D20A|nr:urease accessory protein UreD [Rhodopseudomonas palustris]